MAGAAFSVALENLTVGHSYWIDPYAVHNGIERYDAPPADHAWRMDLDNVPGDTTLQFSHNTNFTNIGWEYLLSVRFSGMNPHVGQRLFLRVVDSATNEEVGRATARSVPGPDFAVAVPGIQPGRTYHVDFFADRDGDGQYDPPPTDHAWRISGVAANGDTAVDFAHNTSFTDIQWPHLLTLQLVGMNPHVGQKFEARLLVEATWEELGRATIPAVPVPHFQIRFPGLRQSGVYQLDFYAYHNGNGRYDPPPVDHAWRVVSPTPTATRP